MEDGSDKKRLAQLRAKRAGTLKYDGDTPLDKVYAASDLLGEARRGLPTGSARAEFATAEKALRKLESAVEKAAK